MKDVLHEAYAAYLAAVTDGDRQQASNVLLNALAQGAPAEVLIQEVIAKAQVEVGHGWQNGKWSIAMEHRASGIAESALAALTQTAMAVPGVPAVGSVGHAVVACSEGEWHVLPGRMVTDVLRLNGIDATFIGPSTPAEDLAATLSNSPPPVVAVTCSMPMSLFGAWRTIWAARQLGATIICGGRGFGARGQWATSIGADIWAPNLIDGVAVITRVLSGPRPEPRSGVIPDAAAEVSTLVENHDAFVDAANTASMSMWGTEASSGQRPGRRRIDFGASLDAITASVLVSDPEVLIEHTGWLEELLASHGLSSWFVSTALTIQRDVLPSDLVQTRATIDAALATCSYAPSDTPPFPSS